MLRAASCALALVLAGCVVPSLDLGNKSCPCGGGYVCDGNDNTCVALGGSFGVSNLRSDWTTPNQIHWLWDATGTAQQFRSYELLIAPSQTSIDATTDQGATLFLPADNPELGQFALPRTGSEDQVLSTFTDKLLPSTTYYAQLLAVDANGRAAITEVVSATTTDPPLDSIVIFEDAAPPGYTLPGAPQYTLSTDRPFSGTHDFEYVVLPPCTNGETCGSAVTTCDPCCAAGSTACNADLRFAMLGISLSALPAGSYMKDAYLELAIAADSTVPSYYSDTGLWYGDGSTTTNGWVYAPWTMRNDDQYRVMQFPLRMFAQYGANEQITAYAPYCEAVPQTGQTCTPASAGGLFQLSLYGLFTVGAKVRMDSAHIFY
jgi:hypothetical protein